MAGKLVPLARCVGQNEIDAVIAIDDQIRELKLLRNQRCGPIIDKLLDGIPVDPGPHSAAISSHAVGSGRMVRLVLDGRMIL